MAQPNGPRKSGATMSSYSPGFPQPGMNPHATYGAPFYTTNPSGMMHTGMTPKSGNTRRGNTSRPSDVVCCDQTYAKSKQGIFKLVMLIGSFIAWVCCATTPYVKRIYPIGGVTWPFHMVMFFTVTANLALIVVYAIFTSGYHRRRKRKPWPTYELYFNIWLICWFFSAAMIESFHAWRWHYGPYTAASYPGMDTNKYSHTSYSQPQSNVPTSYYSGWDMKVWCQRYPADCQRRMNAALYYNPWWPTHIWICINLWILVIVSIVATVYAWKVNKMYKDFIDGVNEKVKDMSTKKDINTNYMDQMLSKLSKPKKNASASSQKSLLSKKSTTKPRTSSSNESKEKLPRTSSASKERINSTSTKKPRMSSSHSRRPSVNDTIEI
ncbi:Oidioi.mRNA.OKI2018_I69.chr1.g1015.t1.cds [Oikopleura dioica]|uniref:Oidioi.mRNA.OKI2018_I69.chr1.g1015.t1.cds n=1 Tax=Oikopleura dioica TaxID=34765 RepID=A0ABN7SQE9_OIKDI|nr:Oidioi.mRNA.OKI2018_I69.chr1.g1015.t1.cds [Oikopleura dioica]